MLRDELVARVAYSRAGRDQYRAFMILDVVNESYVLLVDGDLRKVEAPKMKNLRHLSLTDKYLPDMRERLERGEYPGNHEIRKALKKILNDGENTGKGGLTIG